MKEQFREWNPKTNLSVKFDRDGVDEIFTIEQRVLLKHIQGIVVDFESQDIKLTNRQLYYQLVAKDIIPNHMKIYKRICVFLTDARYGGLLDWDPIEDRGRTPSRPGQWDSMKEFVEIVGSVYRKPRWEDQDIHLEVYCEKQALESVLQPICKDLHVYFGCNKGYASASMMYDLGRRIRRKIEDENKEVIILYLGDHDPSGLDMPRDIETRLDEFIGEDISSHLTVEHIALTTAQVKAYKPPPNPAKFSDPRADGYVREYGKMS
jgi:hypothetical protein